ncbi:hypothetical protein Aperf_G00000116415 [Anoplocephala perfoliata]
MPPIPRDIHEMGLVRLALPLQAVDEEKDKEKEEAEEEQWEEEKNEEASKKEQDERRSCNLYGVGDGVLERVFLGIAEGTFSPSFMKCSDDPSLSLGFPFEGSLLSDSSPDPLSIVFKNQPQFYVIEPVWLPLTTAPPDNFDFSLSPDSNMN